MRKKLLAPLCGAFLLIGMILLAGCAKSAGAQNVSAQNSGSTDPQRLLIPRWFLSTLTLDGKAVDIPADQQAITIQFEPGSKANGTGGCNSFNADYQAGANGKLSLGPVIATMMACADGMERESAYFNALAKVQQFSVEGGKLTLSSTDGKTSLVFRMPPK